MAKKKAGGKLMRAALVYLKKANSRRHRPGRLSAWSREHVFTGHIRPGAPKGSGWHYRPGGRDWPDRRIDPASVQSNPVTGVYSARAQYFDPSVPPSGAWRGKHGNHGRSSFFPDHWTPSEVDNAITTAFHRSNPVPGFPNMWRGTYRGMTIEGYYDNGDVGHGWPVM
ncbi:EndoU domain-containing protein [Asanoa sp. NPDC050611]|uniref:EndoU domain-containing protein n=1 Tax=Asanoa sp. NPDC050611 TaxID=3157098 RepID=UPI003409A8C8